MWRQRLQVVWADSAYEGELWIWVYTLFHIVVTIVRRSAHASAFVVLPKRWIVERTFAWFDRYRRLSKDYEHCPKSSEAMVYLASIHLMLKRLPS